MQCKAKGPSQEAKGGNWSWALDSGETHQAAFRRKKKQDNDLKHTAKAAKEWLIESDINILETVSPDLNPVERTQDKSNSKDAKSYFTDN